VPISIDEFESGAVDDSSVPERVVRFLAARSEQAFMRTEIAAAIDADENTVSTALSRLHSRGMVRHRGTYWAITDDSDRLQAAYDVHTATEALNAEDGGIDPEEWDDAAADEELAEANEELADADDG
jgi:Mn-dependent DtxR family transcriptional regulator